MGACCLVASWFEGMTWLAVAVALWTLSTPSAESYGTWRRNERRRQDQLALIEWERKFRAAHAAARVELEIVPDWMR